MGVIARSQGVLEPASTHLLSEVAIVVRLAAATLAVDWSALTADYGLIRGHIARVVPGFEDYNARIASKGSFLLAQYGPRAQVGDRRRQSEVHHPRHSRGIAWRTAN